jgi:hypothetical protein
MNPRHDIIWTAAYLIKNYGNANGFSTDSRKVAILISTDKNIMSFWVPMDAGALDEPDDVKKFIKLVTDDFKAKKATLEYRVVKELIDTYIYANIKDKQIANTLSAFDNLKQTPNKKETNLSNQLPMIPKKSQSLTKRMGAAILKQIRESKL